MSLILNLFNIVRSEFDLLDVIKLTEYSLRSGHALRTCASARCIRTATVSPLSPTAGRVRETERLCSGGLNSLV